MSRTQTTAKNVKTVIMVLYVSRASIFMLSLLPAMVTSYCIVTAVFFGRHYHSYSVYVSACMTAEVADAGLSPVSWLLNGVADNTVPSTLAISRVVAAVLIVMAVVSVAL